MATKKNFKSRRNDNKFQKHEDQDPRMQRTNQKCDNRKGNKSTSFNDPAWYGMDQALLRDSASVPFVYPMGAPVDVNIKGFEKATVPGICTMELCPTIGFSADPKSAINVAAKSLYTYVRHANSGSRNYDAPDMMMYILAAADVFSYINYLQRVYGVAMLYNQMNRYIPEALLQAMHIQPDSIRNNLANFRYGINVLINKASSLAVPSDIALFRRKAFLYSNIYKEGISIKDQLYMFVPTGFYQYSDPGFLMLVPLVPGTVIVPSKPSATNYEFRTAKYTDMTYEDLLEYGNSLLDTLFGSEDMGLMNGDILKAYGSDGILKLQELPENYSIDFVFDIAVLEQMKNAYTTELWFTLGSTSVAHDIYRRSTWAVADQRKSCDFPIKINNSSAIYGPYISSFPCTKNDNIVDPGNKWITTQSEVITPDLVMENSRLIPGIMKTDRLVDGLYAVYCMTEVLVDVTFYQFNTDGITLESTDITKSYYEISEDADNKAVYDISRMGAFRFRPLAYLTRRVGTAPEEKVQLSLFTNIDNYTVCDNQTIMRLNETALLSLLNVPSVAKAY